MSIITVILEPDAEGILHLPAPEELRHGKVKVTATLEAAHGDAEKPSDEEVLAAFELLRSRGTFKDIVDTVAWQREIRKDRPMPGRE